MRRGLYAGKIPFDIDHPYRVQRPASSKIIFLSCEGSVTEEEYFDCITQLFHSIQSRIQIISAAENAVYTIPRARTLEQNRMLSKCRPLQLVERMEAFVKNEDDKYQFSHYPDDEFWIVMDVDKNWSSDIINAAKAWSYLDEWKEAIRRCEQNQYHYAVSNPFFELWLLIHHDEVNDLDKQYAVTDTHAYEATDHFRSRLDALHVPLKDKKHINESDYTISKVEKAIERAKALHIDPGNLSPQYLATTVYLILEELISLYHSNQLDSDIDE